MYFMCYIYFEKKKKKKKKKNLQSYTLLSLLTFHI